MSHESYAEAIDHYNESLRINPKQAGILINRALCHYHLDRYRDAMTDYDQALTLEPSNFVGHYNRGLLRANVGEDNLAIEDFNFILSIDPDDMMATFNRATLLENIGDYQGAIRDYTTVIQEFPKFLYGYERRAAARHKIGDIAGANRDETHLLKEQIAQRYGYSTPTSRQQNKTRKKSQVNLNDYQKLVEEDNTQEKVYESEYRGKVQNKDQEATLLQPSSNTENIYNEAGQTDNRTTVEQAYQQAQSGNINDAIAGFTRVIEQHNHFAEAYFNRGLLQLLLDNTPLAISDLSKAGELGISSSLHESQVELGFLAHHILVPFRLENHIHVHGLDGRDTLKFLLDVFEDEISGRAVGGGEGHVDVHIKILAIGRLGGLLHVNLVYHAEVPHVDRNLGVEHRLEVFYGLLFYFVFCHIVCNAKL